MKLPFMFPARLSEDEELEQFSELLTPKDWAPGWHPLYDVWVGLSMIARQQMRLGRAQLHQIEAMAHLQKQIHGLAVLWMALTVLWLSTVIVWALR